MKFNIEENGINQFLDVALHELAFDRPEAHVACPQCQWKVRFPVIARRSDVEDFRRLMTVAHEVLKRHGVTALLLSEMHSEIAISIAKGKKNDQPN